MVNFATWIPDCGSHSPGSLNFLLSSEASIYSTMTFPPLENSDHVAVSVSINFPLNSQWDAPFHHIAYDYSCADCDHLCDHLQNAPWEDLFKLSASAAASEFCECVRLELMYIFLILSTCTYQASLISMVFRCLCCCHSS